MFYEKKGLPFLHYNEIYWKNSKHWDIKSNGTVWSYDTIMPLKVAGGVANSKNTDQTAPVEQSDLSLYCLLRPTCPNTINFIV